MQHQRYGLIQQVMRPYTTKGKKSAYKRKQMRRLIAILDDILQHECDPRLSAIGKRQIIRYWKRTRHETAQTRREKFCILRHFFAAFNVSVSVPEPLNPPQDD